MPRGTLLTSGICCSSDRNKYLCAVSPNLLVPIYVYIKESLRKRDFTNWQKFHLVKVPLSEKFHRNKYLCAVSPNLLVPICV